MSLVARSESVKNQHETRNHESRASKTKSFEQLIWVHHMGHFSYVCKCVCTANSITNVKGSSAMQGSHRVCSRLGRVQSSHAWMWWFCFLVFSCAVWITAKSSWKRRQIPGSWAPVLGQPHQWWINRFIPLFNLPPSDDWLKDFSNQRCFFFPRRSLYFASVLLWSTCKAWPPLAGPTRHGPPASATCPQEALPRESC